MRDRVAADGCAIATTAERVRFFVRRRRSRPSDRDALGELKRNRSRRSGRKSAKLNDSAKLSGRA